MIREDERSTTSVRTPLNKIEQRLGEGGMK